MVEIAREMSSNIDRLESNKFERSNCHALEECREKGNCGCKDLEGLDNATHHHNNVESNSSFLHSVMNMVGMFLGLGQLSISYSLQKGGWASSFVLVGLAIICTHTSLLLGKCLKSNPKLRDYKDIGYLAVGSKGRALATSFVYLEIFMSLISYTISLHDNLSKVFLEMNLHLPAALGLSTSQILTTIAILVALPSLWLRNLSSISFLSTGGILMSFLIFSMVACTAIFGGVGVGHNIPTFKIHNMSLIAGIYFFSFSGHTVVPNLYKAMKDPSKFIKVSIVSFSIVTILYLALAFLGATMFGSEVNSQITLDLPSNLIFAKIALWATIITPMTKYALNFAPFAMQLEQSLPRKMKPRTKMIIRGSVGSVILLLILVLALSVRYFEYVLGLTGSLVSAGICVILPCAFYIKIFWGNISMAGVVINLALIFIAIVLGACGSVSSFKLLVKKLHEVNTN